MLGSIVPEVGKYFWGVWEVFWSTLRTCEALISIQNTPGSHVCLLSVFQSSNLAIKHLPCFCILYWGWRISTSVHYSWRVLNKPPIYIFEWHSILNIGIPPYLPVPSVSDHLIFSIYAPCTSGKVFGVFMRRQTNFKVSNAMIKKIYVGVWQ